MELIESDIIANGIKLHIYRTNTDKRPLVFGHGLTDNGLCYWPMAQQFADDFEVILYDSRNHGQSEALPRGSTLIDRAHDLAGLVDTLGLQKPALIGHSLGAVTVALYAGLYPQGPERVVLEDPPPFELMAASQQMLMAADDSWRQEAAANKRKSVGELVAISRQEHPHWPEAEHWPWALAKQQFSVIALDEKVIEVELGHRIVGQITCPLLIITADMDQGAIFPQQAAGELLAKLPNAQHVHIPGAGHNIRRDQPEAYLAAVRAFLLES